MSESRFLLRSTLSIENIDWFSIYTKLAAEEQHHVLLESGQRGRFSIIGLTPFAILKGKDQQLTVETEAGVTSYEGDLLTNMREWLRPYDMGEQNEDVPFTGGAIGFFSYDLVRQFEKLPKVAADDLNTYDLYFYVFDDLFIVDHKEQTLHLFTHYIDGEEETARARLKRYEQQWLSMANEPTIERSLLKEIVSLAEKSPFSEAAFISASEMIKDSIQQGDVFQVNLTVRQAEPLHTEPMHIYEKLREVNPSPYMAYLQSPEFQIVSGSPELLVKKSGQEVSTRPIAGTRSRGFDSEEDERLANTLKENEKERAEHMMLVDVERSDLGRVCEYGTIEVDELLVIEKYSHVMHIVSNVRGILAKEYDSYDLIRAMFPGGTITGAPKVRTLEMLEELEPVRRGIYTGSIGWLGFNGDMELNVVIRTLIAKDGIAYVQAGAGIVVDSNPKAEYKESLKKAAALWRAKQLSEEECRERGEGI